MGVEKIENQKKLFTLHRHSINNCVTSCLLREVAVKSEVFFAKFFFQNLKLPQITTVLLHCYQNIFSNEEKIKT